MPGVPYYIAHPVAGSGGANDLFAAQRPLGAGRVQLALANNAILLLQRNPLRILAQHPGFVGFTAAPVHTPFTNRPGPFDISWRELKYGTANVCFGTFHVPALYDGTGFYLDIVLKSRARVRSGADTMGLFFGITPGRTYLTDHMGASANGQLVTGSTFVDVEHALSLTEANTAVENHVPAFVSGAIAGTGAVRSFTAWAGGYVGSGAGLGDWIGLSLYLRPRS